VRKRVTQKGEKIMNELDETSIQLVFFLLSNFLVFKSRKTINKLIKYVFR
jgi:hypothetical protein